MVSAMGMQQANEVVIAEAAAWVARLQGSQRTASSEIAFKEWLAADPAHARAFSRATDVWELIPGAARYSASVQTQTRARALRRHMALSLAACAALVFIAGAVALFILHTPTYATGAGQQQTLTLSDGTRVVLNTRSELSVDYSQDERRVRLERGEGLFEVARDAHRPFIVQAGEEQVRALGTRFLVRKESATVAVTLLDGRVELAPRSVPFRLASSHSPLNRALILSPGERVTVRPGKSVSRDRPKVQTLTAWQRGEVMFDDVSLLQAVGEINRYGETQLGIAEPELAHLRVSGVFKTQDPREFAQVIARLHELTVRQEGSKIWLGR